MVDFLKMLASAATDTYAAINEAATNTQKPVEAQNDLNNINYNLFAGNPENKPSNVLTDKEQDSINMSPLELYTKYGFEEGDRINRARQGLADSVTRDRLDTFRSLPEQATDFGIGVAQGVASIGALPAVGMALAGQNEAADLWTDAFNSVNESIGELKTDTLQTKQKLLAAKNEFDQRESDYQYEQDKKSGAGIEADFARIGRGILNSVVNASSDSATLADGIAQGIGSMAGAGILNKAGSVVKKAIPAAISKDIAEAATRDTAKGLVTGATLLDNAGTAISKAGMPLSIGLQEGGATFAEISGKVSEMTHTQLMQNSETYAELIKSGMSPEEAKSIIRNDSGLAAAAISGAGGALLGTLTGKFEANPFAVTSIRDAAFNAAKETVEEGLQGGVSSIGGNYAIQQYADKTQQLSQGVGEQIGEGAIYGLGTAGVLQTPTPIINTVSDTVNTAASLLKDRAKGNIDKVSPTSTKNITENNNIVSPALNAAVDAIQEQVNTHSSMEPKEKEDIYRNLNTMKGINSIPEGLVDEVTDATSKEAISNSTNSVEAIMNLASAITSIDPAENTQDFTNSVSALLSLVQPLASLYQSEDGDSILDGVEDSPEKEVLNKFAEVLGNLQSNPELQEVYSLIERTFADADPVISTVPEEINSSDVKTVLIQAEVAPLSGSVESKQTLLFHDSNGTIELTEPQRVALKTSIALINAAKEYDYALQGINGTPSFYDMVRREVEVSGGNKGPSAREHFNKIKKSILSGDIEGAAGQMERLFGFIENQKNKYNALQESKVTGKPTSYTQYNHTNNTFNLSKEKVKAHKDSEGSARFERQIQTEGNMLVDIYNGLADAFPELGVSFVDRIQNLSQNTTSSENNITVAPSSEIEINNNIKDTPIVNESGKGDRTVEERIQSMTDAQLDTAIEGRKNKERTSQGTDYLPLLEAERARRTPSSSSQNVSGSIESVGGIDTTSKALNEPTEAVTPPDNSRRNELINAIRKEDYSSPTTPDEVVSLVNEMSSLYKDISNKNELDRTDEEDHARSNLKRLFTITDLASTDWESFFDGMENYDSQLKEVRAIAQNALNTSTQKENTTVGEPKKKVKSRLSKERINKFNEEELDKVISSYEEQLTDSIPIEVVKSVEATLASLKERKQELQRSNTVSTEVQESSEKNITKEKTDKEKRAEIRQYKEEGRTFSIETLKELLNHEWNQEKTEGYKQALEEKERALKSSKEKPEAKSNFEAMGIKFNPGSWFSNAFSIPSNIKSRYLGLTNLKDSLLSIVDSMESFTSFLGSEPKGYLMQETSLAFKKLFEKDTSLFNKTKNIINQQLQVKLDKKYETVIVDSEEKSIPQNKTFREHLLDGYSEAARLASTSALHLWDSENNQYQEELVDVATTAGISWLINAEGEGGKISRKVASSILGINEEEVTAQHLSFLGSGLLPINMVDAVASKIEAYWGLTKNKDAPSGITRGIAKSLAGEILSAFVKQKLLTKNTEFVVGKEGNKRRIVTYTKAVTFNESIKKYPTLLDEIADTKDGIQFYLGEDSADVPNNQMHSNVPNTKEAKSALKANNQQVHRIDRNTLSHYLALGKEGIVMLFGKQTTREEGRMNENDLLSKEGFNTNLVKAYEALENLLLAMQGRTKEGEDYLNTPIRFGYNMSVANRMQQLAAYGNQSSKLMREVVLPNSSTLDMKSNLQHKMAYTLAIAQAWGQKIHQDSYETTQKNLSKKMKAISPLVQELKANTDQEYTVDFIKEIKSSMEKAGIPVTPHAFHALIDLVRYNDAAVKDELSSFTTQLYIEADGITNGPVNGMVLMTVGEFSETQLRNFAKGGLHFSDRAITNNKHRETDQQDLYKTVAIKLSSALSNLKNRFSTRFSGSKFQTEKQHQSLMWILQELLPGITSFKTDDSGNVYVEIDRSVTKNPLTITFYGSGTAGIAGNIANELITVLYERMSEALDSSSPDFEYSLFKDKEKYFAFQQHLNNLFGKDLIRAKDKSIYVKNREEKDRKYLPSFSRGNDQQNRDLLKRFSFSTNQIDALIQNIKVGFVEPMVDAIADVTGTALETNRVLIQSSSIQSGIIRLTFDQMVEDKIKEKFSGDTRHMTSDFLSENELREIHSRIEMMFPVIKTGEQNISFVAGSRQQGNTVYGQSLDEQWRTPNMEFAYDYSGVSAVPLVIIGSGDGYAMQYTSNMEDAPKNDLKVFDGDNFSLETAFIDGEKSNEAITASWSRNVIKPIYENFKQFVENSSLTALSQERQAQLQKMILDRMYEYEGMPLEYVVSHILSDLKERYISAEARVRTFKEVTTSVDQMASLFSPYVKESISIIPSDASITEKVRRLNLIYERHLEEVREEENDKTKKNDISLLVPYGVTHEASGASVVDSNSLKGTYALRDLERNWSGSSDVLKAILTTNGMDNTKYVFGSIEQINEHRISEGMSPVEGITSGVNGFIDLSGNSPRIYIINGTVETVVHETIHAATFKKLFEYYSRQDAKPSASDIAIQKLETLMEQFRSWGQDIAYMSKPLATSYMNAIAAMNKVAEDTTGSVAMNKAKELNEFMAWVLTNKELSELAKNKKANKLALWAKNALNSVIKYIRARVFGAKVLRPKEDVFSNILFNTAIISTESESLAGIVESSMLNQEINTGADKLYSSIKNKVFSLMQDVKDENAKYRGIEVSEKIANEMQESFDMSPDDRFTFRSIVSIIATKEAINPSAILEVGRIYRHALKHLTVESLMEEGDDRQLGQQRYDALLGTHSNIVDSYGRLNIIPSFLGMALVNPLVKKAIDSLPSIPEIEKGNSTLNSRLESIGNKGIDTLSNKLLGTNKSQSFSEKINILGNKILDFAAEAKMSNDLLPERLIDKTNKALTERLSEMASWVENQGNKYATSGNKYTKLLGTLSSIGAKLATENGTAAVSKSAISLLNKTNAWPSFRNLLNDLVGNTDENVEFNALNKAIKADIQQDRQNYLKEVPQVIAGEFSRVLEEHEWTTLGKGTANIDISSLGSNASEYITNSKKRKDEIKVLLSSVANADNSIITNEMINKINQLATYLNTGEATPGLLRNAYAIERNLLSRNKRTEETNESLVKEIDKLISLIALDNFINENSSFVPLVQEQKNGVDFLIAYLIGQRTGELDKMNSITKYNHYKGYIPEAIQEDGHLVLAEDGKEGDSLLKKGYVRIESYHNKQSFYFLGVSSRAAFNQGMVQNVNHTMNGVNQINGLTTHRYTPMVLNPAYVRKNEYLILEGKQKQNLIPVFNELGAVVAFETALPKNVKEYIKRDTNVARNVGVWRGRQVEEQKSKMFNTALLQKLKKSYEEDIKKSPSKEKEYINIFDSTDPIIKDAIRLFTPEFREEIKNYFPDGFMVRKDLIDDVLGYRSASTRDFWTGETRWNEPTRKAIESLAMTIAGGKAYKLAVQAEDILQNLTSEAKLIIAVKSVIVPVGNIVSNLYQLLVKGISVNTLQKNIPRKLNEIEQYTRDRLKIIELEARLRAVSHSVTQSRQIEQEIRIINDTFKRLSIWPLLERGEFSSVADAGLSREDIFLAQGKIAQYMESKISNLPSGLQTIGKYAIIARDTALFEGMQKSVQYGDFIAKSILYDHYISKGYTKDKALGLIMDEFVNYDRLPGRARDALEKNGVLWFYNFKLRSVKVALSIIRDNPLQALLLSLVPALPLIGNIGTPVGDNVLGKIFAGTIDNSIGPMQGLNAVHLNPWVATAN